MGARHRCPGLATETRLPTRVRHPRVLSHRVARPTAFSADSSPTGAAGRTSLVDFCNRINLRARPIESFEPRAPRRQSPAGTALPAGGYAGPSRRAPFGSPLLERGQSRGHGSGALRPGCVSPALPHAPPLAIARKRELRPNPIDSDTSCRKLVATQAGVSRIAGASFPSAPQLRACPAPSAACAACASWTLIHLRQTDVP
jgi:hypothetical protein